MERIWQAATHWYRAGMQPAIQVCLRRDGRVILDRAIGHGWGNGPADPPDAEKIAVTTETPFCVYSAAKAITTTVAHMLVERGAFSLDDRVCEYLPGYTSHGKDRTTIRHVMTHSAGVPFATGPKPDLKRMDDSEYAREMLGAMKPVYPPGRVHMYHGVTWGPLMREIISAAPGGVHVDPGGGGCADRVVRRHAAGPGLGAPDFTLRAHAGAPGGGADCCAVGGAVGCRGWVGGFRVVAVRPSRHPRPLTVGFDATDGRFRRRSGLNQLSGTCTTRRLT
ncbi:MAG: serine hydrolase, partial [Mycobacterium sp.]|nr:serine hydrolase [Mycobacterium sp.]